jgi:hypothetical protein
VAQAALRHALNLLRIVSDLAKLFFFSWLAVKVDAFFNIVRQLPALLIGLWAGLSQGLPETDRRSPARA